MTREEAIEFLRSPIKCSDKGDERDLREAMDMAIKSLEQEPCDSICKWFEQYVNIVTDIVELRFSDGTVKRAKRGLYMRDIEKSIRKMLIDQMADEKKQEPCWDCISRQAVDELSKALVHTTRDKADFLCNFWEGLQKLPPVTPAEKVGYWIYDDDCREHGHCSECGYGRVDLVDGRPHNYCSNCGIKMEV